MPPLPNARNVTVHFSDDELELLERFNRYCKISYQTKSGWIKRKIHTALTTEDLQRSI